MFFNQAAFFASSLLLVGPVLGTTEEVLDPTGSTISSSSEVGQRLLSNARLLNQERDVTWVSTYDIKYTGCSSLVQVRGEEGGGGEEGILYTQNLVKFSLCPSDSTNCKYGAEYVVNMRDFVDAYTENRMNEQEQICENIRENCYCNNGNDDNACANQCYTEQGMEVCIEYEGQEEFEIQEYIECKEMEEGNNNNNANYYYNNNGNGNNNYNYNNGGNWQQQYFIGPYCSARDGFSILLGVFYDEGCSARADTSIYASRHYGMQLPFSTESIVKDERISCMQMDDNNNNNNYYNNYYNNGNNNNGNNNNGNNNNYYYQNYEVNELCQQVYEQAARCETNLKINYGDKTGCKYIHKILPRLESATRSVFRNKAPPGKVSKTFAWIFAFTTILFGSYSFFLYRKLARKAITLDTGGF